MHDGMQYDPVWELPGEWVLGGFDPLFMYSTPFVICVAADPLVLFSLIPTLTQSNVKPLKVGNLSVFNSYLLRHLQRELAIDH